MREQLCSGLVSREGFSENGGYLLMSPHTEGPLSLGLRALTGVRVGILRRVETTVLEGVQRINHMYEQYICHNDISHTQYRCRHTCLNISMVSIIANNKYFHFRY